MPALRPFKTCLASRFCRARLRVLKNADGLIVVIVCLNTAQIPPVNIFECSNVNYGNANT